MKKWLCLLASAAFLSAGPRPPSAADQKIMQLASVPDSKITHKVQAVYPLDALEAGVTGVVTVSVMIGTDGHVEHIRSAKGHPLLVPAALQALRQWTFEPFERNGQPVHVITQVDIPFGASVSAGASR